MEPIKACPFCNRNLIRINGGKSWYHEHIAGCILKGFMFDDIKADVDQWNRRPSQDVKWPTRKDVSTWKDGESHLDTYCQGKIVGWNECLDACKKAWDERGKA